MDRRIDQMLRQFKADKTSFDIANILQLAIALQRERRLSDFYTPNIRNYICWRSEPEHETLDEMGRMGYLRRPNKEEIRRAITAGTTRARAMGAVIKNSDCRIGRHIYIPDEIKKIIKYNYANGRDALYRLHPHLSNYTENMSNFEELENEYYNDKNCFEIEFHSGERTINLHLGEWWMHGESLDNIHPVEISYYRKIAKPGDILDVYLRDKDDAQFNNLDIYIPYWVDPATGKFIY
jgi:hypothetical protein